MPLGNIWIAMAYDRSIVVRTKKYVDTYCTCLRYYITPTSVCLLSPGVSYPPVYTVVLYTARSKQEAGKNFYGLYHFSIS